MMVRLLTGSVRAQTIVQREAASPPDAMAAPAPPALVEPFDPRMPAPEPVVPVAPAHASVIASPRPAPGGDTDDVGAPAVAAATPADADDDRDESAADAGAGRGRFGRFIPHRGGGDRSGFDVRNSWQIIAGSFLVPAGVVIILMAWYGAAHTRYVQQQIPYLVSGAFIGLGCMVLGGLLYWAHWMYRIHDQADLNHEEMMKAFEQTLRVVADRLTTSGPGTPAEAAAPATTSPGTTAPADAEAGYVATATGSVYQQPSCPVVAHHGDGLRFLGGDDLAAMEPCRICLPRRPSPGR
jgi:hypothetical protein